MDFDDFVLDVTASSAGDGTGFARVTESPDGRTDWVPVALPSARARADLAALFAGGRELTGGREVAVGKPSEDDPVERLRVAGAALADGLFHGAIRSCWGASVVRSRDRGRGLRVCLRLPLEGPGAGELHQVPWEILRLALPGGPLVLDWGRSLVRRLVVRGAVPPPPPPRRLRVLAVSAGRLPGLPDLDFAAEIRGLEEALDGLLGVDLRVEPGVSLARIGELVDAEGCNVLHVMAHGSTAGGRRAGRLYLPGGSGVEEVDGERLAAAVHDAAVRDDGRRRLRLVVLNACRTAEVVPAAPFTALATALQAHAGVPAVVAMQYPIRDAAAVGFSAELYVRLSAGAGIDEAVRAGRRRLRRDHGIAWAVPVLYSDLPSGRLFAPRRWRRVTAVAALALFLGALTWWFLVGRSQPAAEPGGGGGSPQTVGMQLLSREDAPADRPTAGIQDEPGTAGAAGGAPIEPTAGGSPARPAHDRPPEPESLELQDGETVAVPSIGGTLTAKFRAATDGGAVLTLTVDGDSGTLLVFGPRVFSDVRVAGRRYTVEVVAFDVADRYLRVRPPQLWTPP